MSTGTILSILAYPQSGFHTVYLVLDFSFILNAGNAYYFVADFQ